MSPKKADTEKWNAILADYGLSMEQGSDPRLVYAGSGHEVYEDIMVEDGQFMVSGRRAFDPTSKTSQYMVRPVTLRCDGRRFWPNQQETHINYRPGAVEGSVSAGRMYDGRR